MGETEASCYTFQLKSVNVTVITLIGLYTLIHLVYSVHNNVGVHSFIY